MNLLQLIDQDPNSILAYETQPETFEYHKHLKGQLTFFEGGSSHLHTQSSTYFIPNNHFAWIPAGLSHKFVHIKKQKIWVRTLYIPQEHCKQALFQKIGIYAAPPLLIEVMKFTQANEYESTQEEFKLILALLNLLPRLKSEQLNLSLPLTDHYIIKEVISHILKNLNEPITVSAMAEKYHLSERSFSRLFYKEIRYTFYQYLKTARIMRSIELIIKNEQSLTQIAFDVGYGSLAAFSNAFFSLLHKRPTDFKV